MSSDTLREQAYRYIHGKIATGELTGGSQVSEQSLANEMGISRTPVREAIRQLIMEGLVEQVPRFGTLVRIPDRRELAELYEVREALESYAAAEAARRITPEDLELLTRLYRQMRAIARRLRTSGEPALEGKPLQQFLAADMGFHLLLIRAVGNRRMLKITADMRVLVQIFGHRRQVHTAKIVLRACRYHRQILEALRTRDAEAARDWTVRHLHASRRQTLASLDQFQASEGTPPLPLPEALLAELKSLEDDSKAP
jgi:DNA-binding GntR family transcriptional regulator